MPFYRSAGCPGPAGGVQWPRRRRHQRRHQRPPHGVPVLLQVPPAAGGSEAWRGPRVWLRRLLLLAGASSMWLLQALSPLSATECCQVLGDLQFDTWTLESLPILLGLYVVVVHRRCPANCWLQAAAVLCGRTCPVEHGQHQDLIDCMSVWNQLHCSQHEVLYADGKLEVAAAATRS